MYLLSGEELAQLSRLSPAIVSRFDPECAGESHYVFRFGGTTADFHGNREEVVDGVLTLPPGAVVQVHILEGVALPWNVIALIGPPTEVRREGLNIVHGPTIDPGYSGAIELVAINPTSREITLTVGDPLLKAVFFDITRTRETAHVPSAVRRRMEVENLEVEY